jgi:hypothetical protein
MNGSVYLYFGDCVLTLGSFEDLSRLGITPEEGLRLSFYDFDADGGNNPTYLCAEGVIHHREDGRWFAVVDPGSFRSVPRTEISK